MSKIDVFDDHDDPDRDDYEEGDEVVAWIAPQFNRSAVDKAGKLIIDKSCNGDERTQAELVVNNWRSSHSFPLNTIQNGLRKRAQGIDKKALVAQRIKRLESIQQKLVRFPTTRLSQLQDLGGCRAIVDNAKFVDDMVSSYRTTKAQHELVRLDDYMSMPQKSGYRGVHMIYKYSSAQSSVYNGLRIEIQIRSTEQHAWATAVETAGTFLRQGLKSNEGEAAWLRFFAVMSSAIALREGRSVVPGTPTESRELIEEVKKLEKQIDVRRKLRAFGATIKMIEQDKLPDAKYYLLELNPAQDIVRITGFLSRQLDAATRLYMAAEKAANANASTGAAAVLVSAGSVANLRRAYPNYFLDTDLFLSMLSSVVEAS